MNKQREIAMKRNLQWARERKAYLYRTKIKPVNKIIQQIEETMARYGIENSGASEQKAP